MKTLRLLLVFLVLVGVSLTLPSHKATANFNGVSFQVFYDGLMPYGNWVMDQRHGYVWIPNVGHDFHPYGTNGHWVMTTYGNTWVSHYDWGWAPFHYGRWFFDDFYGWAWVPGYEWGPAWVSWRTGGGYYGWAPMGPGIAINVGFHTIPNRWYVFVPQRRFFGRNLYRYYAPRARVVNIYNQTTIINNTYVSNNRVYVSGPDRRDIERATRSRVPVYHVGESNRPGRASVANNQVNLYRPEIDSRANRNSQARPARVSTAQDVSRGRNLGNNASVNPNNSNRVNTANSNRVGTTSNRIEGTINNRGNATNRTETLQNNRQNTNRNSTPSVTPTQRGNTNQRVGTTNRSAVRSNPQVRQSSPAGNTSRPQSRVSGSSSNQRNTKAQPARSQQNQRNTAPRVNSGSSSRSSQPAVRSSGNTSRSTGTTRSSNRSNNTRRAGN
ncbi:DUF6600 domain-containing protein [Pararhodonellum marinum]|uniref:DUF6600 domain-containing protein n=1 Tax=Pararhodonellum marinum TaxID=2755358 RepID=UPI00188F1FC8|nr:DUF6600 domain-containing protein [Pararhodonellum marinum]